MDSERAKQIVESLGVIEVLYDGSPVWIEQIKGENAKVTLLESKKKLEVPVKNLVEGNKI